VERAAMWTDAAPVSATLVDASATVTPRTVSIWMR
jgi:Fe-S-cluster formation regulator IscX/YfhJ